MSTANKCITPFASFACILYFSITCSMVSANELEFKKIISANENTMRKQQETIEAMRNDIRALRDVIEEIGRGLQQSTNKSQAIATPKVESKVVTDELGLGSGLIESPAYARDFELSKPNWRFSATPRTALRFGTFHDFSQSTDGFIIQEEAQYWTNGLTFSVTTPWLPETSFLITGLYGQDEGEQVIGGSLNPTTANTFRSTYDADIYDFEILARTPIAGSNANWLAGIQHLKLNFDYDNPIDFGLGTSSHVTVKYYLAKVGLGGFFNVSDNGFHRIFSNIILGGGFLKDLQNNKLPKLVIRWAGFGNSIRRGMCCV